MTKNITDLIQLIGKNNAAIKQYSSETLAQYRNDEQAIERNGALSAQGRADAKAVLQEQYKAQHVAFIGKALKDNAKARDSIVEVATDKLADLYSSKPEDSARTTLFNRELQALQFDVMTAVDKAQALGKVDSLRAKYSEPAYQLELQDVIHSITPDLVGDEDAVKKVMRINASINSQVIRSDDETALAAEVVDNVDALADELIPNDERNMSAYAALKQTMGSLDVKAFNDDPTLFIEEYEALGIEEEPEQEEAAADDKPQTLDEMNDLLNDEEETDDEAESGESA